MSKESWECPYCNHHVTITEHDRTIHSDHLHENTKHGNVGFRLSSRRCPNSACEEFDLTVTVHVEPKGMASYHRSVFLNKTRPIMSFNLRPDSIAKPQPDYIPIAIRQDYEEACKILQLSPKASATLSRRCLQGMIRDFWPSKVQNLKTDNLWEEIKAIQEDVDPETWKAIKATKDLGNIGAHMEKDVNLIIDVTSKEGEQLVKLIETLFEDWYIARHKRTENSRRVQEMAAQKKQQRDVAKNSDVITEECPL